VTFDQQSVVQHDGAASTADLVSQATSQISTLIRDELALAKAELVTKGKRAGIGGGLVGAAGVLAGYGLGLVIALGVVALDVAWPLWLAVAAVAVIVFVAAGVGALLGKRQLTAAAPAIPSEATAGVSADVQAVKDAIREGRQS
jgi:MFS family permease